MFMVVTEKGKEEEELSGKLGFQTLTKKLSFCICLRTNSNTFALPAKYGWKAIKERQANEVRGFELAV